MGLPCWPGYGRTLLRVLPEGFSRAGLSVFRSGHVRAGRVSDSARVRDNLFLRSSRAAGLLVMQCISWPETAPPSYETVVPTYSQGQEWCTGTSPETMASGWIRAAEIEKRCYSTRSKCIRYKTKQGRPRGRERQRRKCWEPLEKPDEARASCRTPSLTRLGRMHHVT